MQRLIITMLAVSALAACGQEKAADSDAPSVLTMENAVIFPESRSLQRPEDGEILQDGALVLVDQRHGLVALSPEGEVRPYGDFAAAGYRYEPPAYPAAPNGVTMEPDGVHLLAADVLTGAIYRIDSRDESVEKIHQHEFGVNTARADSAGAVWFTQSTENNGPDAEARMFAAVDTPFEDGALFRIAPDGAVERKAAGFKFANGFVIDEAAGMIYISETMGDRVLGFAFDAETGAVEYNRVIAEVTGPDNLELKEAGRLWVASPMRNEIIEIEIDTGETRPVFSPASDDREAILAEWERRGAAGESRLELLGPELTGPMPGLTTGVVMDDAKGVFYVTGLGDAVVKVSAE